MKIIFEKKGAPKKLFILVGPPSAGKSTWIESNFGAPPRAYVISRDDIADEVAATYPEMRSGSDTFVTPPEGSKLGEKHPIYGEVIASPDVEKFGPLLYSNVEEAKQRIEKKLYARMKNAVKSGQDIIVDMTSMKRKSRKKLLKTIGARDAQYERVAVVFQFEGSEDIIVKASKRREQIAAAMGKPKPVPEKFIRHLMASFEPPTRDEGFDEIISFDNREKLTKIVTNWEKEKMKELKMESLFKGWRSFLTEGHESSLVSDLFSKVEEDFELKLDISNREETYNTLKEKAVKAGNFEYAKNVLKRFFNLDRTIEDLAQQVKYDAAEVEDAGM